jgi:hypothetical protein
MDADGALDVPRLTRTVKSCGPDVAVLALSLRSDARATEAKEPFSGESTKQAVKPLRREAGMLPPNLYARVHLLLMRKRHAGPRVRHAPGLPCAL